MGRRKETSTAELLSRMAARVAEEAPEGWRRGWVSVHRNKDQARLSVMRYELASGETRSGSVDLLREAASDTSRRDPR